MSEQLFALIRRILFPYSGREPLTHRQGLGVIVMWSMFFSLSMFLCTFPFILVAGAHSLRLTIELLLVVLLSGVVIFGLLGWLVVAMNNRAARIIQQRQRGDAAPSSANGGSYGS